MNRFTTAELNSLSDTQESAMQDTCNLITYSGSYNEFGELEQVWTTTSGIACGVKMVGGVEEYRGQFIKLDIDAVIRLPIDTEITELDRVEVTKRFGVDVDDMLYEVVGFPKRGSSGLQVDCKKVTF
jgi:hypothetical protein